LRRLAPTTLRDVARSPDGGGIADYEGSFDDPAGLAAWLGATPGLVAHGLFPPSLVREAFIARADSVERIVFTPRPG
jgi:ribose 5-phosphate isomerase A